MLVHYIFLIRVIKIIYLSERLTWYNWDYQYFVSPLNSVYESSEDGECGYNRSEENMRKKQATGIPSAKVTGDD